MGQLNREVNGGKVVEGRFSRVGRSTFFSFKKLGSKVQLFQRIWSILVRLFSYFFSMSGGGLYWTRFKRRSNRSFRENQERDWETEKEKGARRERMWKRELEFRGGRFFLLFLSLSSFTFLPIDSGSVDTFSAAARVYKREYVSVCVCVCWLRVFRVKRHLLTPFISLPFFLSYIHSMYLSFFDTLSVIASSSFTTIRTTCFQNCHIFLIHFYSVNRLILFTKSTSWEQNFRPVHNRLFWIPRSSGRAPLRDILLTSSSRPFQSRPDHHRSFRSSIQSFINLVFPHFDAQFGV